MLTITNFSLNRTDWLGLTSLIFTLFGLVYVTGLGDSYFLKGTPNFNIDVTYDNKTIPQIEILNVNNTGNIQAKNVKINLNSHDTLYVKSNLCHEGIITKTDTSDPVIQFDRMSQNINCRIEFSSNNTGYTYLVTVSAEDSPGKQKSFNRIVPDLIQKQKFALEQFQTWTNLFVVILSTIAILSSVSLITRNLKKKKLRAMLKENKIELEKELVEATEEHDELKEKFRNIDPTIVPEKYHKKYDELELKIRQISNDIGRTKGKLSSDIDIQQSIGEFFMRWWILEQRIMELAEKNGIVSIQLVSLSRIIKELSKKGILTKGFMDIFEPVKNFRNELAHGVSQPTKKQVTEEVAKIHEILQMLDNIETKK